MWNARVALSFLTLWTAVGLRFAVADIRDSFESADPTWRMAESDCGARVALHERTFRAAHSGSGSEFVRITAQRGTFAYLVQEIPPARSITELGISLWVRSDRPGIQILARAVFPRAIDARTGKPIRIWIRGTQYDRVGGWQMLSIPSPNRLIKQQSTILNAQLKTVVDPREAYVDLVALNAYGSAAVTNLWIDDMEIAGHVLANERVPLAQIETPSSAVQPASFGSAVAGTEARLSNPTTFIPTVAVQGTLLLVQGKPFVPRIVQHQGESLTWLKSLGFNTVQLNHFPTLEQLDEAQRQKLWLITPPQPSAAAEDASVMKSVLAWSVGNRSTALQAEPIAALASDLRRVRDGIQRPLLVGVSGDEGVVSRLADILRLDPPLTADSHFVSLDHLRSRAVRARPAIPLWMTIPVTSVPAAATTDSAASAAFRLPGIEPIRWATYQAIAAGARGFSFASNVPLDGSRPGADFLADRCQAVNRELALMEPWLAAGSGAEQLVSPDPERQTFVLPSERSRLVISLRQNENRSTIPYNSSFRRKTVAVLDPGAPSSTEAYHVTPRGLASLRNQRTGGGVRVEVPTEEPVVMVLFTQDSLAIQRMNRLLIGEQR